MLLSKPRTSTTVRTMADSPASQDEVLAIATRNEQVCPMPQAWNRLYDLLPGKSRVGAGWEPALPLILSAWHDSTAAAKGVRFREHIEWAARHGALDKVHKFLATLPEDQWFHLRD